MKPTLYLAGAIQHSPDAFSWREQLRDNLSELYDVIIPDSSNVLQGINDMSATYADLCHKHIVMKDMGIVANCDHFFALLDAPVFKGAGTISELSLACYLKKPVVYMQDMPYANIPQWTRGCLRYALQLCEIDEVVTYYKRLSIDT